jgi:ERF superfamily
MIRSSEKVELISGALVLFHKDLPSVKKDAENPHFHSRFASLAGNIEAADKKAAECGLCVVQLGCMTETGEDGLATRIIHSSGQWMEAVQRLHLPKDDPQGQGSAMTYGRRYNYQGAYGLVAEDDDGESASHSETAPNVYRSARADSPSPSSSRPASEKQRDYVESLAKTADINLAKQGWFMNDLSAANASALIEAMKSGADLPVPPKTEDEAQEMIEESFGFSDEPF